MKDFLDLGNLYDQIKSVIASKEYKELELPQTFKAQLTTVGDRRLVYYKHTVVAYKNNADSIIIPNYWFYLALDILPFNVELHRYYDQVVSMKVFSPERLNQLKNSSLSYEEKVQIKSSFESEKDVERICRFLTDYRWWHGGKELGRVQKDYYVSAVLSLSGLVNDSSTFLSAICEVIRENPQLSVLLVDFNKKENGQQANKMILPKYLPYITAIKSKPFLLLAGISGTGKSRIVRELARACWDVGSEEYEAQKPRNFEMVQVKPNWHDSSELIGYVSRVSGQPEYVAGNFLRFISRAWVETDVPYFLCLDEMNLAPVEQYFAEYLSVVESRKNIEGNVVTDSIVPAAKMKGPGGVLIPRIWYSKLVDELLSECPKDKELELKSQFINDGICLPPNLIVVGTVNMDETTFSFSRKVLDRAMTIEMNEVELSGGLDSRYEHIGKLGASELIGDAVEGVDVYCDNVTVCDKVINYLKDVNDKLDGTPFKIAYRTRNEFLLYVVNNLPYKQENESQEHVIARALDEITSMKILSRIEGDETKVSREFLDELKKTVAEGLTNISGETYSSKKNDEGKTYSISLAKLEEMKDRLKSGYTSFWS